MVESLVVPDEIASKDKFGVFDFDTFELVAAFRPCIAVVTLLT